MAAFLMVKNSDLSQHVEITDNKPEELLVIGAGLPRTGTLSMKSALTILLKGKCYHMAEVLKGDQEDLDIWLNGFKGENTPQQWRDFFKKKGYVSGVDYPISLQWKELSEVYPNAKIVLTTRNPDTWYTSVKNSIWSFHDNIHNSWTFRQTIYWLDGRKRIEKWFPCMDQVKGYGMKQSLGPVIDSGPEASSQFFKDWEEVVKATIPPERLLVHSAKEGWAPLCKFLGLPIPDEPYPRLNDTASIQKGVRAVKMVSIGIFYVAPALLTALATYLFAM